MELVSYLIAQTVLGGARKICFESGIAVVSLSIGKVGVFTNENLLFFEFNASCSGKDLSIDDHPYLGVGFLDIERVSVETERNLERVPEILDFLRRKTLPEVVPDKKTGTDTEESDE